MKFKSLDGKEINKEVSSRRYPLKSKDDSRSLKQFELGQLLLQIYPSLEILEEMPVFGTKLKFDFFIPSLKLIIEYDGQQHFKLNKFFHSSKNDLKKQIERDTIKMEWCKLNNFRLVRLNGNLSMDKVEMAIINDGVK